MNAYQQFVKWVNDSINSFNFIVVELVKGAALYVVLVILFLLALMVFMGIVNGFSLEHPQ